MTKADPNEPFSSAVYLTFGALDRDPKQCPIKHRLQPRREVMAAEAAERGWETCCFIPMPEKINMTNLKTSLRRLYGFQDEIESYAEGNTTWVLNNVYHIELNGFWAVLGLTDSDAVKLKMLW